MVKLFCAIVGVKGSAFPVQVDESDLVGDLKNAIKANKEKNPIVCDARELQLFLAKKGDAWLPDDVQAAQELKEGKVHQDIQALIDGEKMEATWTIDKVLNASNLTGRRTLNNRQIHILVVVPPAKMRVDTVPTRTVPRVLVVQDSSSQWLERYLAAQIPSHSLPLVDTLSIFIQEDLPVKIGMKQDYLQRLMDSPMDVCPTLIDKLFTVENASPCNRFDARIMTQIISPVGGGLSTYSFICFWDLLIQVVLTFVFVDAKIDRYDSAMGLKRPAFVFLLDNVCVFRGEEGGPYTSINVPRDALQDNLMWSYGDVPYMFGYAVVGYYLELYALVPTVHGQDVVLLGRFQLDQWMERVRFLLALLKLSQLFQAIADICPDSGRGEYRNTK